MGRVLVLVDPLAIAFEEDLQRRRRPTSQLDGVAPDDVGIPRLPQEVGQRPRSRSGACGEQQQTVRSFIFDDGKHSSVRSNGPEKRRTCSRTTFMLARLTHSWVFCRTGGEPEELTLKSCS